MSSPPPTEVDQPVSDAPPARPTLELPPEVLVRIVAHVLPSAPTYAELQLAQTTFNSLSLVSSDILDPVRKVRYAALLVPTAASAHLLLDHTSPAVHSLVRQQLRSISFGRAVSSAEEGISDRSFAELLAVLGGGVQEVRVAGVKLGDHFLWAIKRGLRKLELNGCVVDFRSSEFRLPLLAHLGLRNVVQKHDETDWDDFIRNAHLPTLAHLAITDDTNGGARQDKSAALRFLAPRLVSLELGVADPWLDKDDPSIWPLFSHLKHLHIIEPDSQDEIGHLLVNSLHSLSHSLQTLDIATSDVRSFTTTAWNVTFALRERLVSVRGLKRLVLPVMEGEGWEGAARAGEVVDGEARGRGVAVEYVEPREYQRLHSLGR